MFLVLPAAQSYVGPRAQPRRLARSPQTGNDRPTPAMLPCFFLPAVIVNSAHAAECHLFKFLQTSALHYVSNAPILRENHVPVSQNPPYLVHTPQTFAKRLYSASMLLLLLIAPHLGCKATLKLNATSSRFSKSLHYASNAHLLHGYTFASTRTPSALYAPLKHSSTVSRPPPCYAAFSSLLLLDAER